MTFRIAQISDTHLSAEKPFFVANFACVVRALIAERPDLVVNSGDISLDGATYDGDLAEARRLHDTLNLPTRFIPGNHDVGDNADVGNSHEHAIDAARHARYRRYFGHDWWTLDVPGWRILAVNAQLFGSDLDAARQQEAFVAQAAAGANGRQIALFVHKPLFNQSEEEDVVGGRFLNPAPRRRLLAALGAHRPALVASGHVHQYRSTHAGGTRHVWAPSTAFILPDTRQPRYGLKQVGYVAHELRADGGHDSRFVTAPGSEDLDATDFPSAYGPMD